MGNSMSTVARRLGTGNLIGPRLSGPYKPIMGGFGKVSGGIAAVKTGWLIGHDLIGKGLLEKRLNASTHISNLAYKRIGPAPKWLIRTTERLGIH